MVHICALTSFSEGSCSTLLPFRSGAMFLTFHFIVHLRCFLKVAILHYFPSRVWLDVYNLRFRLFPEPLLRLLKYGNSPTAQTARIFTFTSQMLFFGNNLRLDGTHLRSDE